MNPLFYKYNTYKLWRHVIEGLLHLTIKKTFNFTMLIIADTCSCHKCLLPYYKNNRAVFMIIGGNFTTDTSVRVNNVTTDLTAPLHLSTYPDMFAYLVYTFHV